MGGDTGVGVTYKPSEKIKVEMAYLAKNTNNPASGLFNGNYGVLGQIVFYPDGMCTKDQKKECKIDQIYMLLLRPVFVYSQVENQRKYAKFLNHYIKNGEYTFLTWHKSLQKF
ncbi:MAG: hypothetical protein HC773_04435 [Scytonema sp. CRU_2_7]|nr:hypothetical protein [Scytonema sp. CRU_2_7]